MVASAQASQHALLNPDHLEAWRVATPAAKLTWDHMIRAKLWMGFMFSASDVYFM